MLKKFLIAEKKKSTFDINKQNSMCSKKMFNLLDKGIKTFCNKNNIYLEIGVYLGATLTVLAENNPKIKCIGVDDFSFFNKNKKNYSIVKKIIKDKKLNNTFVLNKDFEDAFTFLKKKNIKVGIIFVDGSHDYRSTLITLLKYYNLLTKNSLIVIDDSNYYHVRKANDDFLNTHKDCHLVFQKYTKTHISNLSNKKKIQAFNGYGNGVNVIYKGACQKKFKKKIKFEKNEKEIRKIFSSSHEIFRHYYSPVAVKILNLAYDIKFKKKSSEYFLKELKKIRFQNKSKFKRFKSANFN